MHPKVVPFAQILIAGLPAPPPPLLTRHELEYCVELLGHGVTLKDALDRIQAARPSLPFNPPEAA